MAEHIPVLGDESAEGLNIKPDAKIIDGTIDGGGHTEKFLQKLGPGGKILGIDWDPEMEDRLTKRFPAEKRLKLTTANFGSIESIARSFTFWPDAIFFDLGLSSLQLQARPDSRQAGQASGRGFSFQRGEPLIMTFHPDTHPNAREFINLAPEKEIERVIRTYGEERRAKKIARAITAARMRKAITTAAELAGIILHAAPRRGKIHPATKTFQAIRIHVNRELENLNDALLGSWNIIKPGGRVGVVSFHSLEDRIVKNFFREKAKGEGALLITKKPIRPRREEQIENPRSRSAKLRILQKLQK